MGLADKIKAANFFESGVYLGLGEHEVTIKDIIYKSTTAKSGEVIVAEFQVDASTSPSDPVGAKRSTVFKLSDPVGQSSAKGFFYAAMGVNTPEERAKADAALGTLLATIESGKPTPLNGQKVRVTVAPHVTRDKRNVTKTLFSAA